MHNNRIIGEGFHQKYGEAHAEVNCLGSVVEKDRELIAESTLYVSMEPCAHFGKTPPCTDLIIRNKIPRVVIGCRDPFSEVNGKGIEKLRAAGLDIESIVGSTKEECEEINRRFFSFHLKKRPFIILKWAQTGDGFTSSQTVHPGTSPQRRGAYTDSAITRLHISNEYSDRIVHKWRSEEAAILIGTNTALMDDPQLTNRLWTGPSPIRLVIDMNLRLPSTLKIFDGSPVTIIFNGLKNSLSENMSSESLKGAGGVFYYKINGNDIPQEMAAALHQLRILSLFVEGGTKTLQSFIDEGLWDEARVITSLDKQVEDGIRSPVLSKAVKRSEYSLKNDRHEFFKNQIYI